MVVLGLCNEEEWKHTPASLSQKILLGETGETGKLP